MFCCYCQRNVEVPHQCPQPVRVHTSWTLVRAHEMEGAAGPLMGRRETMHVGGRRALKHKGAQ